jgi:hypothetical protein
MIIFCSFSIVFLVNETLAYILAVFEKKNEKYS